MAITTSAHRCCLLFMALGLAVAVAAAARSPPSFAGELAGGSPAARVVIMHDVPSGQNPIHNDRSSFSSPPSSSTVVVAGGTLTAGRVVIMHDVPSGQNPVHNNRPSPP
ncbi:hypothetical protein E2562_018462 [Oryza meyeriana var. granulata]|uniref:Dirigent protein n=1 Tax=Oryza meyeriana var. granulata TaxID=110450 RepID=A0A6G1EMF7_9ORYZ|nr:hypothetical protein E2562_018462 [Oryza meyeriana var. granulata]